MWGDEGVVYHSAARAVNNLVSLVAPVPVHQFIVYGFYPQMQPLGHIVHDVSGDVPAREGGREEGEGGRERKVV